MLVANPVPKQNEIAPNAMAEYISRAVSAAQGEGIKGKAVTPWLLSKIIELTDGKSLATNVALICNNAKLAGEIAVSLA